MVLHGEERELTVANSLDGSIVQVEVGDLERWRARNPSPISNHRETMVLGGDQDLIAAEITHRVIAPSVTVGEFCGRAAVGQPNQLMAEADAERGQAGVRELADGLQGIPYRSGIAGAVGKEEAIRL
jgi:hypothetical protein